MMKLYGSVVAGLLTLQLGGLASLFAGIILIGLSMVWTVLLAGALAAVIVTTYSRLFLIFGTVMTQHRIGPVEHREKIGAVLQLMTPLEQHRDFVGMVLCAMVVLGSPFIASVASSVIGADMILKRETERLPY